MSLKVGITGANGFIGQSLINYFLSMKYEVAAFVKDPQPSKISGLHFYRGCLGEKFEISDDDLRTVDVLIHLANDPRPGKLRLNVDGTICWFDQAKTAGVKRQFFMTSCSALPKVSSDYGRSKYELENTLLKKGALVVRLGLVIGKGGLFLKMSKAYGSLRILPVLGGDRLKVFVTGLNQLHDYLFQQITDGHSIRDNEVTELFNASPIGMLELARTIQKAFDKRGFLFSVPFWLALSGLRCAGAFSFSIRNLYLSLAALKISQDRHWVSDFPKLGIRELSIDELIRINLKPIIHAS